MRTHNASVMLKKIPLHTHAQSSSQPHTNILFKGLCLTTSCFHKSRVNWWSLPRSKLNPAIKLAKQVWWPSKIQCKATKHLQDQVLQKRVSQEISAIFFLPLQNLRLVFFFECAQDWYLNSFAFALTMVFSLHFYPTELLSVLRSNISKTTNNTSNACPLCRHKKRVLARYTAGGKKGKLSLPSQDDFLWWMLL